MMNDSINFHPPDQYYHHGLQLQQQELFHTHQMHNHNREYPPPAPNAFPQPMYSPQSHHCLPPPFQTPSPVHSSIAFTPIPQSNTANFAMPPPSYHIQPPNLSLPPPAYSFQNQSPAAPPSSNANFQNTSTPCAPFSMFNPIQLNITPTGPKTKKTQHDIDQEWVENWSQGKKKLLSSRDDNFAPMLSITEAQTLLVDALLLLKELGLLKESLAKMFDVDEKEWRTRLQKALKLKEKLQTIQRIFSDSSVLNDLKIKMRKRTKKRMREKQKRHEENEEHEKKLGERQEMHRVIDTYRNAVQEKVLEHKRKCEMQAEADNILAEVKRKIQETKRAQECTQVVEKLRQIRKDNSQKKGLHVSRESDEAFQRNISSIKELLEKQMSVYEAEEKALKVMLESEREEQREMENAKKQQRIYQLLSDKEAHLMEDLFGGNNLDPCHPLYFYWQYYMQGEHSLENLLQIRHQWDAFLTEHDDEGSSCIPTQWVVPIKPSSDLWSSMLQ